MKFARLAPFLVLASLAVGCGGGGLTSNNSVGNLQGDYTGTYTNTGATPFSGTIRVVVDKEGQMSGSTTDTRYGNGTISDRSRITSSGRVTLITNYENGGSAVTTTTAGKLTVDGATGLTGTLNEATGTSTSPVNVVLGRTAMP